MITTLHIVPAELPDEIIRYLLGFICHQDKEILISVWGNRLPVCPRCIGLHLGFFLTLIYPAAVRSCLTPRRFVTLAAVVSIAGIHWLLGVLNLIDPGPLPRLLTGLSSGIAFGILLNSIRSLYTRETITKLSGNIAAAGAFSFLFITGFIFLTTSQFIHIVIFTVVITNIVSLTGHMRLITRIIINPASAGEKQGG